MYIKMCHILFLFVLSVCMLDAFTPTPYVPLRSQSQNGPRELVGLTQHINLAVDYFYGTCAITPEYSESFDANRLADCLFGQDLETETLSAINITGSGLEERNIEKDWLADYFGLPRDFNGTVKFEPLIWNFLSDIYLYLGLNNIAPGLYFTIHAPIVYTNWDLNFFEVVAQEGTAPHPSGYFNERVDGNNVGVLRSNLLNNFTDYAFKQEQPDLGDVVSMCPLEHARMVPKIYRCEKSRTGLSDIQAVLGWNFIQKRLCHVGAGLRVVAPTGNRPRGIFVFEPMVGNGGHWEAGVQLWAHTTLWLSENEEKHWLLYGLANCTHMFNAKQCRVFDLCGKPNSRWMLAQRFTPNVQQLRAALLPDDLSPDNLSTPIAQFDNCLCPVANLTTREVNVRANLHLDATALLSYANRSITIDFGYNIWYRSCEKISKTTCGNSPLQAALWALKGDSYTYGFSFGQNMPPVPNNTPVALSATQSKATIHEGTNNFTDLSGDSGGIDGMRPTRNPGVDNRFFAAAQFPLGAVILNDRSTNAIVGGEQTNSSNPPLFISEDQLDLCSAASKGLSHKLFIHLSHSWFDYPNEKYVPYIGGGGQIEAGQFDMRKTDESKHGCQPCALSQWSIWLKGGVSF